MSSVKHHHFFSSHNMIIPSHSISFCHLIQGLIQSQHIHQFISALSIHHFHSIYCPYYCSFNPLQDCKFFLLQAPCFTFIKHYWSYTVMVKPFFLSSTNIFSQATVVEWLTRRTDDQHGLGSKPTCTILLCPWERHFTALSPAWWSWQAVLNYSNISTKLLADSNILASPEAGRGNFLPYV